MSPIGRKFRIARTAVFAIGGVAVLAVLAIVIAIRVGFNTEGDTMGAVQKTAISKTEPSLPTNRPEEVRW